MKVTQMDPFYMRTGTKIYDSLLTVKMVVSNYFRFKSMLKYIFASRQSIHLRMV